MKKTTALARYDVEGVASATGVWSASRRVQLTNGEHMNAGAVLAVFRQMHDLMETIEWHGIRPDRGGPGDPIIGECPYCLELKSEGHETGCPIDKLARLIEGVTQ